MAAEINFFVGEDFQISNLSGSGIGWFGANGAGYSVSVGEYNSRAWVVDSTGTLFLEEIDNNKYVSSSGITW